MTKKRCDGRIEACVGEALKYRRHAQRVHGMKLATWLKMLAHRDFTSRQKHD